MNISDRRAFLLELLNRTKEHIGRYCPVTDGMVYDGMCCALHFALEDMVRTANNIPAKSHIFLVEHCKSVFPKVYLKIRADISSSDYDSYCYLYPLNDEGYVKKLAYLDDLIANVDLYT